MSLLRARTVHLRTFYVNVTSLTYVLRGRRESLGTLCRPGYARSYGHAHMYISNSTQVHQRDRDIDRQRLALTTPTLWAKKRGGHGPPGPPGATPMCNNK